MNVYKVLSILIAILIVSILSILYLIPNQLPNDSKDVVKIEIIKSLLGIISIALIGGVVSLLLKLYERSRELSNLRVQTKINFMKRADELYRIVKSSRRRLIANKIEDSKNFIIPIRKEQIQIYLKEMEIINSVQLELEGMSVSVQNFKLFDYPSEVSQNLKKMEEYLRKVLKESEENFMSLKDTDAISIQHLPVVKDFTSHDDETNFKTNFSKLYYEIISHLS